MNIRISVPLMLALFLGSIFCLSGSLQARDFERGDVNEDGSLDIADAIEMLNHMFLGEVAYCQDSMDVNDDGILDISDAIVTVSYLFLGGDAPEAPFGFCGPDLTEDKLTCESYSLCNLGDAIPGLDRDTFESFVRGRVLMSKDFTAEEGLGPFYNATSCTACHSTPVVGGSSPIYRNFFFAAVGAPGSQGPIWDPPVPSIVMPAYALPGNPRPAFPDPSQVGNNPVTIVQRNAPPQLGVGLFERISNATIFANADPDDADGDGISGRFNTDGNGNLGRFGYKSQANFLEAFLRGASNNQMGITTDPFLGSGGIVSAAMLQVSAGFDLPTTDDDLIDDPEISVQDFGDIVIFSMFVAPPPKGEMGADELAGETLFHQMDCAKCHVPVLESDLGPVEAYTDLLLHDMGPGLADGISMGMPQFSTISLGTTATEFRTQPLWGVGLHGPWIHDGRADTMHDAILMHGGEAQASRDAYEALTPAQQQTVIRFLEAL
ncbi:MAG: di-heme oxidoredictase family protein [Planctomycetota bacterium]|nr:di-heme oxidoredictase family protein [Planctomycetota bacterium]